MIYFNEKNSQEDFKLVESTYTTSIIIDENEDWGIIRAARDLRDDIKKVSNQSPILGYDTGLIDLGKNKISSDTKDFINSKDGKVTTGAVIIGSIENSFFIKQLMQKNKIDVDDIVGKWESFTIQTIANPLPGIDKALVIAGSDKRGTIFGIYELSQKIGVSPWYWWADVPVEKHSSIYVKSGCYKQGEPSVKYRGIFLNDEVPCLTTWVENKFGGFNHYFYEKVFELLLRLKANYLWPAMWKPRVFNEEDLMNPEMADKYGIVMGTSHHEPMMRSWQEWSSVGEGPWDYKTNSGNIYDFWEKSVKRITDYESTITIGMRGDGDEAMDEESSMEEKKELLEKIIQDQREIIANNINSNLNQVPQLLALYKEVQTLYEKGLDIPEDITLLLADDNFGNIRMLPGDDKRDRSGGYGIYYHFDYVGGPRSYQWINTVPIQKIWEQLNMTYQYGVDRIWIVNVGDLKPMEFPIEFFTEMAWDIEKWNYDNLNDFAYDWAKRQFGEKYAADTAEILMKYTKYNGRRKPELIAEDTFSLINYKEAERVLKAFNEITVRAEKIYREIEDGKKDAFFQLVLYPTRASCNVLKMHVFAAKNQLFAEQGRAAANDYAEKTRKVFETEAADSSYYNKEIADGKWNGIMIQPHIGKSNWRGPKKNTMPAVRNIEIETGSQIGVFTEGSEEVLTGDQKGSLPLFSKFEKGEYYFEIFNTGKESFTYIITADKTWIEISKKAGKLEKQERIWVNIDWENLPERETVTGTITIKALDKEIQIEVVVSNPDKPELAELEEKTFIESKGYVSIEAEHYHKKKSVNGVGWKKIGGYGRTLSSMFICPTDSNSVLPPAEAPYLEYKIYISNPDLIKAKVYTAPSLNVNRDHGLRYAVAIDNKKHQIVDTFLEEYDAHHSLPYWAEGVKNNIRITESIHRIKETGFHTFRITMVDPGIVLQKIVLDMGGVKASYLGPPESFYKK
ncbi:MAG: glycosyl hydrolase 115 family protein [Halothermotrichaceae bacterium]